MNVETSTVTKLLITEVQGLDPNSLIQSTERASTQDATHSTIAVKLPVKLCRSSRGMSYEKWISQEPSPNSTAS